MKDITKSLRKSISVFKNNTLYFKLQCIFKQQGKIKISFINNLMFITGTGICCNVSQKFKTLAHLISIITSARF